MNTYTKEILDLLKERYEQVVGTGTYRTRSQMQNYWLDNYKDNLIHPMNASAEVAYGAGAGNEIGTGKISALKSSSALTYNLFWNQTANIVRAVPPLGNGTYSVEFEKQYKTLRTSNFPAHLDAFLYCKETGEAIACEMKMTEWIFNKPSRLRASYLNPNNYANQSAGNIFASVADKEIKGKPIIGKDGRCLEYEVKYQNYDAAQMFKHVVALYRACDEGYTAEKLEVKKLTLLNCAWTLSTPNKLTSEASQKRYAETWDKEINEFDRFTTDMRPIKDLFKNTLDIDFDIRLCTFADLLGMLDKTPEELAYLDRYMI